MQNIKHAKPSLNVKLNSINKEPTKLTPTKDQVEQYAKNTSCVDRLFIDTIDTLENNAWQSNNIYKTKSKPHQFRYANPTSDHTPNNHPTENYQHNFFKVHGITEVEYNKQKLQTQVHEYRMIKEKEI